MTVVSMNPTKFHTGGVMYPFCQIQRHVKVADTRTMNVSGKVKRRGRILGKRRNWKKAIVTLMPGERIEFFEGA